MSEKQIVLPSLPTELETSSRGRRAEAGSLQEPALPASQGRARATSSLQDTSLTVTSCPSPRPASREKLASVDEELAGVSNPTPMMKQMLDKRKSLGTPLKTSKSPIKSLLPKTPPPSSKRAERDPNTALPSSPQHQDVQLNFIEVSTYDGYKMIGPFKPFMKGPNFFIDVISFVLREKTNLHSVKSVTAIFEIKTSGGVVEKTFTRSITGASDDHKINDHSVTLKEYLAELEKIGINAKAKDVFQGELASYATSSPEELTRLFEVISGSGALAKDYEKNKTEMMAAEEETQHTYQQAKQNFEEVKKERYKKFMACFDHVSNTIDGIYKNLAQNQSAQACLGPGLEDADEPYLEDIHYICAAGNRFQSMSDLSGREKTIAALALLFAIKSYEFQRDKMNIMVISLEDALETGDMQETGALISKILTLDVTPYQKHF